MGYLLLLKYLVLRKHPEDADEGLKMDDFYSDAISDPNEKNRLPFVQVALQRVLPY